MMRGIPGIYDISMTLTLTSIYHNYDGGTWCDTIGNGTIRWDYGPRCDREADEICSNNFFRRNILWKRTKIKIIFLDITTRDKQRNKRGILGLSRGEFTLLENNQDPRWILQDNSTSLRETEIRRPNCGDQQRDHRFEFFVRRASSVLVAESLARFKVRTAVSGCIEMAFGDQERRGK